MTALLLAVLLSADGGAPRERLVSSEVTAGLGFLGASFTMTGARWGDFLLTPTVTARGVFGGFTVDGGAYLAGPLTSGGVALSMDAALRVGWTGRRWSLVGGVNVQWTPGAKPAAALLPTARLDVDFGPVGVALGLFDHLALVPAHLDAKLGRFSLGWVAPIGLIASADLELPDGFGLRVSGFAFKLGNAETAMLSFAGTWGAR